MSCTSHTNDLDKKYSSKSSKGILKMSVLLKGKHLPQSQLYNLVNPFFTNIQFSLALTKLSKTLT